MASLSIVTSRRAVLSAHQAITSGIPNFYGIICSSFQETIGSSLSSHHERASDVPTGFAFPQLHSFRHTSSPLQIMTQSSASGSLFTPLDFYCMGEDVSMETIDDEEHDDPFWLSSTLKKRRTKMNKHKLKKRRKKLRLQNKK